MEQLYDCFTEAELDRLREIKSDAKWKPRNERYTRSYEKKVNATAPVSFNVSPRLRQRLRDRCDELHITIREYMTALLEAVLS
jgi:hypothetical protein